jgi:hypothetical protein
MRTSLKINIPKPCHEDWNKMTVQQKGRHCKSCDKLVFDFTRSTDEQIVKTFLEKGNVCGRFKSTQLNKELLLTRKEKNNYLSYVASTLFAFLSFGTQDVEAQGKPQIVKVASSQSTTINKKKETSIRHTKPVSGTIFGPKKHRIPDTKITSTGNSMSTTTDMSGNFTIKVKLGDTLIIEVDGYEKTEIIINHFSRRQIYVKPKLKTKTLEPYKIKERVLEQEQSNNMTTLLGGIAGHAIIRKSKKKEPLPIVNGSLDHSTSGYFLYSMRHLFTSKN